MRTRSWVLLLIAMAIVAAAVATVRSHGGGFLARLLPAIHGH
jgi:hypothetical protein